MLQLFQAFSFAVHPGYINVQEDEAWQMAVVFGKKVKRIFSVVNVKELIFSSTFSQGFLKNNNIIDVVIDK